MTAVRVRMTVTTATTRWTEGRSGAPRDATAAPQASATTYPSRTGTPSYRGYRRAAAPREQPRTRPRRRRPPRPPARPQRAAGQRPRHGMTASSPVRTARTISWAGAWVSHPKARWPAADPRPRPRAALDQRARRRRRGTPARGRAAAGRAGARRGRAAAGRGSVGAPRLLEPEPDRVDRQQCPSARRQVGDPDRVRAVGDG